MDAQHGRPGRQVLADHREDLDEAAGLAREPQQRRAIDRRDDRRRPLVGHEDRGARVGGHGRRAAGARGRPSGWTSSITAPARRMSPRRIPPICVSSNARCTSATNAPSVTTSRTSPTITVATGANARPARSLWPPIAASANSA